MTKFRVWDKADKKFIDDLDIAINQQGLLFYRKEYHVRFNPMSITKSQRFIIEFQLNKRDNNGRSIFEGDTFTEDFSNDANDAGIERLTVTFDRDSLRWVAKFDNGEMYDTLHEWMKDDYIDIEVDGNIHE